MEYVLAVFRARSQTITFSNLLRSYGAAVSVVPTPRKINVSCGISAKFSKKNLETARNVVSRRRFDSFAGFYLVRQNGAELSFAAV